MNLKLEKFSEKVIVMTIGLALCVASPTIANLIYDAIGQDGFGYFMSALILGFVGFAIGGMLMCYVIDILMEESEK
jgi:hypothetical protein